MLIDVDITERYARMLAVRYVLSLNFEVDSASFERLVTALLKSNGVLSDEDCLKIIKG